MEIPSLGQASFGGSAAGQSDLFQNSSIRQALEASRKLNSLDIEGRQFSVIRDPVSQRFVVVVLDQTGAVLDQFPAEDILKMLAQLSPYSRNNSGDTQA